MRVNMLRCSGSYTIKNEKQYLLGSPLSALPVQRPFTAHCKQIRGSRLKVAAKSMELSVQAEDGIAPLKNTWEVDEGSELYTASLRKPLGLVLVEQSGKILVEKVTPGGKGEAAGIKQGDIIRGTTARTKNVNQTEVDSLEGRNKQQFFGGLVLMNADGEKFDTVLAAMDSSKCAQCDCIIVVERPKNSPLKLT